MYAPISDYALIGDCHSAALVSRHASIDWACLPRFDSAAFFLKVLDEHRGGFCSVEPADLLFTSRHYVPHTNILETTFHTSPGRFTVTDFMPLDSRHDQNEKGQDVHAESCIARRFHCNSGEAQFIVRLKPTFDYARAAPAAVTGSSECILFSASRHFLQVHSTGHSRFEHGPGEAIFKYSLRKGETAWLAIGCTGRQITAPILERWLAKTLAYWQRWSAGMSYRGENFELVERSALALKLLVYEPSGAIIAAPTCSLPEWIGGSRNWDYRYNWLRDSSFTLIALMELGYFGEARDFMHFLRRALTEGQTKVLYSVDGGTEQAENELAHLEGYWRSKPVRIGNGAANQRQFDVAGELMQSIALYWRHEGFASSRSSFEHQFWPLVKHIADHVAAHWQQPDNGIWEVRGGLRQFVHSKGLCWVALDRALRLVKTFRIRGDFSRWELERTAIHKAVQAQGFNRNLNSYVQSFGATEIDASLLRLPILDFFDARDHKWQATIQAIERHLMQNGLVYRYNPAEDGIGEREGAFLACGFWLVENYVLAGRLEDAERMLERLVKCANDVGLLSEEADPHTNQLLGNFPQGFSHVGLINAALRLSAAKRGRRTSTAELIETRG
ncbi:MAG: glycoside hydrolase family 15 protein [Acidobacteria bacterium]|nr:glycoside hydrolase family 15 protein [Acidobacteriota bacterium]